ncbi:STAS/SEC14 domain-containing protein [Cyclobacteriaceae bacterium]|nr:STAS/SEC14 domain-containing protein [Cyclobacteriaceae bacterium]
MTVLKEKCFNYHYHQDILCIVYYDYTVIDLETAKYVLQARLEIQEEEEILLLADCRPVKYVTQKARRFLAKEGNRGLKKLAVLTTNNLQRYLANLYISLSSEPIPTKLFKEEKEAIEWLLEK